MKAVVFDLFETLVTEWGRQKYTTFEISSDLNVEYEKFKREWDSLRSDRYLGKMRETIQVYRYILENIGIKRDEELLIRISQKRDECKRKCFQESEPQILEMLLSIKEKGYKIGLISNCSAEEIKGFKESKLYPFFDAVVLSCDVGMVKPDTEIYKLCLSMLNEQPSDCCFIGDGGSNELNGARNVGMLPLRALWFIKHFVKDFHSDKTYPTLLETTEVMSLM
ncbi:MAG: HAD-IA family hydrolase [Clostridiales bacterium]|nr:HAD-IA family hydrolase [Clostridiales bacterium]